VKKEPPGLLRRLFQVHSLGREVANPSICARWTLEMAVTRAANFLTFVETS
jgi:hypothetical protein